MRPGTFKHAAAVAALLACVPARAQQYSFQYFGVEQGLTDLAIRSLFQDRRGFLWLSTETGIFRYDGTRFQAFGASDGIPMSNSAMFGETPDGALLIGGAFGLYKQAGDRFEAVLMPGAKRVNWGSGIQYDGVGRTYVTTEAGLLVLTSAASTPALHTVPTPAHTGGSGATGTLVDQGTIWWGCGDELCAMTNNGARVFGPGQGLPSSTWQGIRRAGNGDLWAQSRSGLVVIMRAGSTRFERADLPSSGFGPRGLLNIDRSGNVIAPVGDGMAIRENGEWRLVGHNAGLHGPVYSTLQDREGSLWIGLAGHGLARWLGYREWEHFTPDTGLAGEIVYQSVRDADGSLWVGTDSGLFHGSKSNSGWKWRRETEIDDIPVHSVARDDQGRLWLGTEGHGAARLDPRTGSVEWFGKREGLSADSPYMILLDRQRRIWAGTLDAGLFVADQKTLRFHAIDDVPRELCVGLAESPDGTLWVGAKRGLFRMSNGRWRRFTTKDGLSHDEILSVAAGEHGELWIGYQFWRDIDRLQTQGDGIRVTHEGRLPGVSGVTYFLGFDAQRRLWAGTNFGVDIKDGDAWRHYDHNDGLVWDDCDLNGFAPMPDGSVWIGTSGGLAHFMPQDDTRWKDAPEAIFTKLTLGGNDVKQNVSVAHDSNSLAARYSSLSFARPERMLFRYRLAPLFSDWRETRQRELQFPGLTPDSYRLEVEARDEWGRWSVAPAVFTFEVRPPWWNSPWSGMFLMTAAAGCVVLIVRRRGRAARQRERRLVGLVDERTAELKKANGDLQQTTLKLQQANQYLVRLSTLDGLTGIANRRMFDETLAAEWEESRKTGQPLTIVLADIDHFKRLNDSAGHQAGDECLKHIAGALACVLRREADLAARFGGEEFALILSATDSSHGALMAESVRAAVAGLRIAHPNSPVSPFVTISLGVATSAIDDFPTAEALIGAADSALYMAKQRGRNRVESFDPEGGATEIPVADGLRQISIAQSGHTETVRDLVM